MQLSSYTRVKEKGTDANENWSFGLPLPRPTRTLSNSFLVPQAPPSNTLFSAVAR